MLDLTGKSILVCGGSGLIGSAIVQALSQCGADLLWTYNQHPRQDQPGHGIHLDVTDPESVRGLPGRVREYTGLLAGYVYCTGINRPAPFNRIHPEDWQSVLDVNLTGAFAVTQALLPLVRDGGSIVFIGSVSAPLAGPVSTHYAVSKSGLETLTRNLALFTGRRQIRVNCVSPGYIQSEMADQGQASPAVQEKVKSIPLGRLGRAEEIGPVVAFLVSQGASYITGQTIGVNGGLCF